MHVMYATAQTIAVPGCPFSKGCDHGGSPQMSCAAALNMLNDLVETAAHPVISSAIHYTF
jgi:hypothetical protein